MDGSIQIDVSTVIPSPTIEAASQAGLALAQDALEQGAAALLEVSS